MIDQLEERSADAPEVQTGGTQSKFSIGKIEADGVYASAIAGAILLFAEMLVGQGLITPLQYAASIIMADRAFEVAPLLAMIAGLAVHASACVLFGFIYGVVASLEVPSVQESERDQVWRGALFGVLVYLVTFQVIARLAYPWFLDAAPLAQLALHALAYGVPLGLAYARLRRHRSAVEPLRSPALEGEVEPRPRVHATPRT